MIALYAWIVAVAVGVALELYDTRSMPTRLWWLNFAICQWAFARVTRLADVVIFEFNPDMKAGDTMTIDGARRKVWRVFNRQSDGTTEVVLGVGWAVSWGALPLTGWWGRYVWIPRTALWNQRRIRARAKRLADERERAA